MVTNLRNKGQSTLEYALVIAVIVAALIAMQTYIKRGFQGKLKSASDDMGEQFSPGASTYDYTTQSAATSHETVASGSSTLAHGGDTVSTSSSDQQRFGSEAIKSYGDVDERWVGQDLAPSTN